MHKHRRRRNSCPCYPKANSVPCNEVRSCDVYTSTANLVAAGTAGNAVHDDCQPQKCLAQINFQVQEYRTGLCPRQALDQGTMFPELVRIYK